MGHHCHTCIHLSGVFRLLFVRLFRNVTLNCETSPEGTFNYFCPFLVGVKPSVEEISLIFFLVILCSSQVPSLVSLMAWWLNLYLCKESILTSRSNRGPKLLFVLVINVDLRFGQGVVPGRYSNRMICSENSEMFASWNRPCSCFKCFGWNESRMKCNLVHSSS